jgi:hypothetical protein
MAPAPAARFQFHLTDLLFISFLIGLGLWLVPPVALEPYRHALIGPPYPRVFDGRYEYGGYESALAILTIISPLAAVWGLRTASRRRAVGWLRYAGVGIRICAVWVFFTLLCWMPAGLVCRHRHGATGESAAFAACKTYTEAQGIYRRTDWDGDGVFEYAQSFRGDFSLYERTAGAADLQIVDSAFAAASYGEGGKDRLFPKHGYVFKVLRGQGSGAPGGRKSYLEQTPDGKWHMTSGYALVACPAVYDATGLYTFIINHTGTVYQADLGPDTPRIFMEMTEYDLTAHGRWTPSE